METSCEAVDELRAHSDVLAEAIVARQYHRQKDIRTRYGDAGSVVSTPDRGSPDGLA